MRSFNQTAILVSVLAVPTLGCRSVPVRVESYAPSSSTQTGAVYFLPKARLKVSFDAVVRAVVPAACGSDVAKCKHELDGKVGVEKVAIETDQVPDTSAGYVIKTSGSFVTKTEFSAEFSEKGELGSMDAQSTNNAVDFLAAGVATLGRALTMATMAGPAESQALATRRATLLAALRTVDAETAKCLAPVPSDKQSPKTTETPYACIEAKSKLYDAIYAQLQEIEKKLSMTSQVRITCILEPDLDNGSWVLRPDGTPSKGDRWSVCPAYAAFYQTLSSAGTVADSSKLPPLTVQWTPAGTLAVAKATRSDTEFQGIVYRVPRWFNVDVKASDKMYASTAVALPQFGSTIATSFEDSDLRPEHKLKIELHAGHGTLKKISTSAVPIDPKKLQDAVGGALDILDPVTRAQKKAEAEAARLKAEAELLKAQKELEDAKKAATTGK